MENSQLPLLEVRNARKSFDNTPVLKGVSFEVHQGEVLAIIGASGGGKSTLLRCCTLLETLDGGALRYGDIEVTREDDSGRAVYASKDDLAKARRRFGLVFQNYNLFPHYTVMQNICDAPIRVQNMPREEAEARARELLAKMGLEGKENMVPNELSGGQAQRVAIARALALKPDVLFFDEPTSALDPELTQGVLRVIRQLAEDKMTMVIVTHEMAFAREVADNAIFLDSGVIVESGSAEQVIGSPREERTRAFLRQNA
ncbi:MAG: amino acid ABC transporter ATP-binding protein, partial [Actinomycetaceae bacterium]|nr:amino acid ABC transporter ATP-binding protein [Actinomycetaceae bacterium]